MSTTTAKRGPGRPRKNVESGDDPVFLEEPRRRRGNARPHGANLGVNEAMLDIDRFVYRFVNDNHPQRLRVMTEGDDWDFVDNDGDSVKVDSDNLGARVSFDVGINKDGSRIRAYLIRKPREYYAADKAEEQRILDEELEKMRRGITREGEADYTGGISIDR